MQTALSSLLIVFLCLVCAVLVALLVVFTGVSQGSGSQIDWCAGNRSEWITYATAPASLQASAYCVVVASLGEYLERSPTLGAACASANVSVVAESTQRVEVRVHDFAFAHDGCDDAFEAFRCVRRHLHGDDAYDVFPVSDDVDGVLFRPDVDDASATLVYERDACDATSDTPAAPVLEGAVCVRHGEARGPCGRALLGHRSWVLRFGETWLLLDVDGVRSWRHATALSWGDGASSTRFFARATVSYVDSETSASGAAPGTTELRTLQLCARGRCLVAFHFVTADGVAWQGGAPLAAAPNATFAAFDAEPTFDAWRENGAAALRGSALFASLAS